MDIQLRVSEAVKTRGNLSRIAELSGLSLEAIRKIASGRTTNPGILTVEKIENALRQIEKQHSAGAA